MTQNNEQKKFVKMSPKEEKEAVGQLVPALVSLVKIARQLGVAPAVVSKAALAQDKVEIHRVGDGKAGGLLVSMDDIPALLNEILVRVNDPKNPQESLDAPSEPEDVIRKMNKSRSKK